MNNLTDGKYYMYQENVLDYMEYIGVPDYVVTFEPRDVAKSFVSTMVKSYLLDISVRMCAILIFGLTVEKIGRDCVKN